MDVSNKVKGASSGCGCVLSKCTSCDSEEMSVRRVTSHSHREDCGLGKYQT